MAAELEALVDRAAALLASSSPTEGVARTHDDRARAALVAWLGQLKEWNARVDLTAARSSEQLVDLMIADALVLAPRIATGSRVVDVGTGAGAPGLALALLRPDLRVTLVEPLGKRAAFLRTVVGGAGRADVAIERTRGEQLAGRRAWDVALSRATLPPQQWLDLGVSLGAPGGSVWVLLAKEDAPKHARAAVDADVAYAWPLTGVPRRAVRYVLT
jgi:16S rRNA (guanine527-N7)-methyltransferase